MNEQTERHIRYLEEFINLNYNLDHDKLKIAKLMLEAYNLARLKGYGGEIAVASYYINSSVMLRDDKIFIDTKMVDVDILKKYVEENSASIISKKILFGDENNNQNRNNRNRNIGFGSGF